MPPRRRRAVPHPHARTRAPAPASAVPGPPPGRLARPGLADEGGPARDLAEVAERLRGAHADRERDLEQTVLVLERERLLVYDAAAGAPHQELALPLRRAQVQRPGLLR